MYYREFMRERRIRKFRKAVKNLAGLILFLSCFIILPGIVGMWECHYNSTAIVREVNTAEVVVEDTTGNLWAFETDGYQVGDAVKVTFYTNHTDNNRKDDVITKVTKIKRKY